MSLGTDHLDQRPDSRGQRIVKLLQSCLYFTAKKSFKLNAGWQSTRTRSMWLIWYMERTWDETTTTLMSYHIPQQSSAMHLQRQNMFSSAEIIPYQCQPVQRKQRQVHLEPSLNWQPSRPTWTTRGRYLHQQFHSISTLQNFNTVQYNVGFGIWYEM